MQKRILKTSNFAELVFTEHLNNWKFVALIFVNLRIHNVGLDLNWLARSLARLVYTMMIITFWEFLKFFFHHKIKETWLLVTKMVYTSCLTSCQTTYDLLRKCSGKSWDLMELAPCALSFFQNKNFVNLSKKLLSNGIWAFPVAL